jgi:Uma2 family endonuclease
MMEDTELLQEVKEWIIREWPRWIVVPTDLQAEPPTAEELTAPHRQMTYKEFMDWCDEDTWAEWVNGEVTVFSPASPNHQRLSSFLERVLGNYVQGQGLGEVLSAPLAMQLDQVREPDLLFVAAEHLDRLYSGGLQGPADVVIEIISPESGVRDRGAKFFEYEAGGVQEYWLLDPLRRWAEFYRLNQAGRYEVAFAGAEGVFRSQIVPGFWLRVEWLWQDPLPSPVRALGEIAGVDPGLLETFVQALTGEAN